LHIIIFLFLLILLIALGLIFIPIKYNIGGRYEEFLMLEGKFSFCSFIRVKFSYIDKDVALKLWGISLLKKGKDYNIKETANKKTDDKEQKHKENKKSEKKSDKIIEILKNKDKIIKLINSIKVYKFVIEGTYGFDDPSITGMVSGFIYSLYGIKFLDINNLSPQFTNEEFNLSARITGQVSVLNMLKIIMKRSN
jgi:hypothetical protein